MSKAKLNAEKALQDAKLMGANLALKVALGEALAEWEDLAHKCPEVLVTGRKYPIRIARAKRLLEQSKT